MFTYPTARRAEVVDSYHGTMVADPYRWLEDPDSEETAAFVCSQNELSNQYLSGLSRRADLISRMEALWSTPRTYAVSRRNGATVWAQHDGLQNQPIYKVQRRGSDPTTLLDPNALSEDGTVAVNVTSLSPDGGLLAYSVSNAGSDWQRIRFRDTSTGSDLADELEFVKFTSIVWHEDGVFYQRFPEMDVHSVGTSRDPSVCYHRIGTDQQTDEVAYRNVNDPDPSYEPRVSHDDRYLVLTEYVGTSLSNGLLYKDLNDPSAEWIRLVEPMIGVHEFLLHEGDAFIVRTDVDAPNGRVVSIPLDRSTPTLELIAEAETAIESAAVGDGHVFVTRVIDGSHQLLRYTVGGRFVDSPQLPGLGTVTAVSGQFQDPDVFVEFQSFVQPPRVLELSGSDAQPLGRESTSTDYDVLVTRRQCRGSDGTVIGMFMLSQGDTSTPAPTDLYGYGGFGINMTPVFNPARIAFIQEGGVVVVANLRGGTEHGEQWHKEGMLGNKQQVFDDFVACAEHLIDTGVTTKAQLSISGRSNGGLLTAATMLQRPELFAAVVSHVPVTDMLRYQHFTAGRYWTVEYGDAADAQAFAWLIDYSPLHNVDSTIDYPPILVTTAEVDDRVVPMHSLKFVAELQHQAGGSSTQPLIVRVESRAGHGMGKPTAKLIEEAADVYAFVLQHCSTNA